MLHYIVEKYYFDSKDCDTFHKNLYRSFIRGLMPANNQFLSNLRNTYSEYSNKYDALKMTANDNDIIFKISEIINYAEQLKLSLMSLLPDRVPGEISDDSINQIELNYLDHLKIN